MPCSAPLSDYWMQQHDKKLFNFNANSCCCPWIPCQEWLQGCPQTQFTLLFPLQDYIVEQHRMDKENEDSCNLMCTLCSRGISCYACFPCGHKCLCEVCAENRFNELTTYDSCPECGQEINQLILVLDWYEKSQIYRYSQEPSLTDALVARKWCTWVIYCLGQKFSITCQWKCLFEGH